MKNADFVEYIASKEKLDKMLFKKSKKKIKLEEVSKIIDSKRFTLYILKILLSNGKSTINDFVDYFIENSELQLKESALGSNFYKYATGDTQIIGLEKLGFIEKAGNKSQNGKQPMTYDLTPNGVVYCWHVFSRNSYDDTFAIDDDDKLTNEERIIFVDPIFEETAKHYSHHFPLILGNFDLVKTTCGGFVDVLINFADYTPTSIVKLGAIVNLWHYRLFISDKDMNHNDITFFFFVMMGGYEIPVKKFLFKNKTIHKYCKEHIKYYFSQSSERSKDSEKQWIQLLK